jgi:hypothetical protein
MGSARVQWRCAAPEFPLPARVQGVLVIFGAGMMYAFSFMLFFTITWPPVLAALMVPRPLATPPVSPLAAARMSLSSPHAQTPLAWQGISLPLFVFACFLYAALYLLTRARIRNNPGLLIQASPTPKSRQPRPCHGPCCFACAVQRYESRALSHSSSAESSALGAGRACGDHTAGTA